MRVLFKALDRLSTHPARRAVGVDFTAFFFQAAQLVVQRVVFLIGNGRLVEYVILVRPFVKNIN